MNSLLQLRNFDVYAKQIHYINEDIMSNGKVFKRKEPKYAHSFVYVIDGKASYDFSDGSQIIVNKDNLLFLKQGSRYDITALSDKYHYTYIDFDLEHEDDNKFENKIYINNAKMVKSIFEKLCTIWIYKQSGYLLDSRILLYNIIRQIIRAKTRSNTPLKKYGRIERSVTYLEKNYMKWDMSIEQLAELSEISISQFRKIFKEIYSISPLSYLNMLRIDRSKDLLKNTGLTITEISEQLGYPDVYSFSKQFKKETGSSPSHFRRNHELERAPVK